MIQTLALILLSIFIIPNAHAKLTVDISEPVLEITTGFTGDTLTLFGTADPMGDIVIVVRGPRNDTVVRRRKDIVGLWINSESMTFKNVPGYYNVASSKPMAEIASQDIRIANRLGINSLTFEAEGEASTEKYNRFLEALIQNKQLGNLYSLTPDAITPLGEQLFKTRIYMPSNVPLGDYEIRAYLFQDGALVDQTSHPFAIKQVGVAAKVHDFAFDKPFLYGLSVILFALFSSLLAILLLRRD
jgi:uncharacterized protein (TIGR02186 family)